VATRHLILDDVRTIGIAPKVWQPVAAIFTTAVVNLIASGEIDRAELSLLVAAGLTAIFGWLGGAGKVEAEIPEDVVQSSPTPIK
jgi:hypothetical protein